MYYKIKFNYFENSTFNQIDTVKKKKLMSIYSYMIKYSVDNKITISASKFHKMYEKYHKGVCLSYFKELLLELERLGLIIIDKTKKIRTFFIPRVANEVANENVDENIDIPMLEDDLQTCNIENFNNNYTNTLNTQLETQNFGEKVAPVELVNVAKKLLKELRIRSKWVKDEVNKKLSNCTNVNRRGMNNYVLKVIIDKKTKQESRREYFIRKVKVGVSTQGSFNNYDQRQYSHEDFISMEYKLLGWI